MRKKIFTFILLFCFIFSSHIVYSTEATENILQIYSESAILIDSKTGLVLYSKNENDKRYPASTTKILTAILAIENCNLNDKVTVTNSTVSSIPAGYSTANLLEGEILTVKELLSVFLVHSANDAGYALAEHISGSIQNFSVLMNKKAKSLGCKNTNFTNPSGLHDENHYTTAYDLSLIAKYCMENSIFRKFVSMKTCTIPATNKSNIRTYKNTNQLLNKSSKYYLKDCIGIKTGFTTEAQNCLISACLKDNLELISIVLGSKSTPDGDSARYTDSIKLLDYGYSNYNFKTIAKKGDVIKTIEIKNGSSETKSLDIILENDLNLLTQTSSKLPEPDIKLNTILFAPIAKNTVLGKAYYNVNGTTYSVNLLASHDVEENDMLIFILISSLASILLIIFFVILFFELKKRKKRKEKYDTEY